MAVKDVKVITAGAMDLTIIDEADDVQVWISLPEHRVPYANECFCLSGAETREKAIKEAVRALRAAATRLEGC